MSTRRARTSLLSLGLAGVLGAHCGGGGTPPADGPGTDATMMGPDGTIIGPDGQVIMTFPDTGAPDVRPVTGTWTAVPSGSTQNLSSIWTGGGNAVFATSTRAILQYNGTSFSAPETPNTIRAVNGVSASDVWVSELTIPPNGSGETGHTVFAHWNGSAFMEMMPTTMTQYGALHARAVNDVWAVGNGAPIHWDGARWSEVSNGLSPTELLGVFALAPNNVIAVGARIVQYNGTSWTAASLDPALNGVYYFGVWASAPNDAWAVGRGGVALHFNGTAWAYSETNLDTDLNAVWGTGPADVWAVGAGGVIVHWNGAAWETVRSSTTQALLSVWGSGPGDVWAAGEGGTILRYH